VTAVVEEVWKCRSNLSSKRTAVYFNKHHGKSPKSPRVQISATGVSKALNYCSKL